MTETATTTPSLSDHTVAVYATHDQAEAAIKSLNEAGYDLKNLSIIGQDYHTEERPIDFFNTEKRMWSWGKYGAFWGTIWGLLFGSAFMFLPGIGHVMFAGYIIGALEGAFIGGSFGVIGGALASLGVPEGSLVEYETALKAGSFLVLAHGTDAEVQRAKNLMVTTPATRVDSYSTKHKNHAGCH